MGRVHTQTVASGEQYIGKVGADVEVISFTPVLDTSAYADNDVMFIATEITGFFRTEGGRAELVSLTAFDGDDQATEHTVFFTTNSTTPGTINGAIAAADTVFDDIQGFVQVVAADYEDLINSQVACKRDLGLILEAATGSTSIYAWAAIRAGTPTHSVSGVVYKLGVRRF